MARSDDETPSVESQRLSLRVEDRDRELFDRAERLLVDRTRFQLSPDAWDELVAVMDREARPNPKLAKLFSRRSAALSSVVELNGPRSLECVSSSSPMQL